MLFYVRFYPVGDENTAHTISFTTAEARDRFIAKNRGFWARHTVFSR